MDLQNAVEDQYLLPPKEGTGKVKEVDGSFYNTILKKIEEHVEENGDWIWLEHVVTGDVITAKEAITYGKKFATFFHSLGFTKGDIVHILLANHKFNWSAAFGAWILGGVVSMGNVSLDPKFTAEQIKQTSAKLLLCSPDMADAVKTVLEILGDNIGHLRTYCLGSSEGIENILESVIDADPDLAPEPYVPENPKKDLLVISWSSGTTGLPKGICHTHYSALNWGGNLYNVLTQGEKLVATIPFFHIGGLTFVFIAIFNRITLCHIFLKDSFNLKTLVDSVVKYRPRQMTMGAHYFIQLSESALLDVVKPEDLESLRQIIPTGSAVPESSLVKLKQKFRNLKNIVNIYGSTELGMIANGFSTSNVGYVNIGCKVKIVDLQTGKRCLPNTMGEICALTPARMSHYLNRPKETDEFFDEEGFGRNGDLGMYSEDGDILCIDRLKEMIKYCGYHVAPTEIEDALQQHPTVLESLVYGRPEPNVMEIVSAVVVLKKGYKTTEAELIEFANGKVSEYKWIRGGIIFRDNIPRNSMGKLVRKDMRDWAIKQDK